MRPFFLFFLPLFLATTAPAEQTFQIPTLALSLRLPDGWTHDEKDQFGYVIHPVGDQRHKARIHLTAYKNCTLQEALQKSADSVAKMRRERGHPPEYILSTTPLTTKSGLKGLQQIIGDTKAISSAYLQRNYFQKSDGTIFCVCVYFFGDNTFAKECETSIINSLRPTK